MAQCDTEKFVYLKEPASGVLKLSIDKARCVMFAFSQRLEIEVFLNRVESNSCPIEERKCGGDGEEKGSNLGTESNSNSSVAEVVDPTSTGSDIQLDSETDTNMISDDDNLSGTVTCSETLRRAAQQKKNKHGGEKLNKEAETEISLISPGHVTIDRASQLDTNNTRKVGTDANAHLFPWIHIKANVPTDKKAQNTQVKKSVKLKKNISLSQTGRHKSSNANNKLTSTQTGRYKSSNANNKLTSTQTGRHKSSNATIKLASTQTGRHKSSNATIKLVSTQTGRHKSSNATIKLTSEAAKKIIKKSHLNLRQAPSEISCQYCNSVFQYQKAFYNHTKTARVPRFQCKDCPKRFPFEAFLQAHTQTRHSEIVRDSESEGYYCDFCDSKFTTYYCFKKHLMFHTKEYFYKCCICGKEFVEQGPLKHHMSSHTTGGMIRCKCCDKLFASRGALGKHKAAVATAKCHLCGENFPNKTSRTLHYKESHQIDIIKCIECNGLFSSQEDLAAHMKRHAMYKKKQCPVCSKFFSRLKNHLLTHKSKSELDKSQLFVCDKCPKQFSNGSVFQRHLNTHSSEKPYQCPNCPRAFQDCGMLRRHLKSHSSFMPYQCDVCGKKCKESSNLKIHMRIHSETKHYPCPLCPQGFNYKISLNNHLKNMHPGSEVSSNSVIIVQSSDYPHDYNTLAQTFTPDQVCDPVAQHVEVTFTTDELIVASSCLQLQLGQQQE